MFKRITILSNKRLSKDGKIDAYNMAISYLCGEECAYDPDGDYKEARLWLADKLHKECDRWLLHLKDCPKK